MHGRSSFLLPRSDSRTESLDNNCRTPHLVPLGVQDGRFCAHHDERRRYCSSLENDSKSLASIRDPQFVSVGSVCPLAFSLQFEVVLIYLWFHGQNDPT